MSKATLKLTQIDENGQTEVVESDSFLMMMSSGEEAAVGGAWQMSPRKACAYMTQLYDTMLTQALENSPLAAIEMATLPLILQKVSQKIMLETTEGLVKKALQEEETNAHTDQ